MSYMGVVRPTIALTSSDIADDAVITAKINDDAVTAAKIANSINTDISANTAKVTNATHTGDVTGATALTIATDAVDIAMLSATGTASATTFLRGDNAWAVADLTPSIDDNGNAIAITINSSEQVGIGGTPSKIFEIFETSNNVAMPKTTSSGSEAGWQFNNTSADGNNWNIHSTGTGSGAGTGKLCFLNVTDGVDTMCLTEAGDVGIGTFTPGSKLAVNGSFSKSSGSFKIDHPIPEKKDTHWLVHSFVESPKADLIYRDKVDLVNGSATVNIDTAAGMTDGTFVLLCDDVQCFTSNETDWDAVKGSVSGNTLTIECQNTSSTANISWMVVGDRKDEHMTDSGTSWTDNNGKPIVEKLKLEESS